MDLRELQGIEHQYDRMAGLGTAARQRQELAGVYFRTILRQLIDLLREKEKPTKKQHTIADNYPAGGLTATEPCMFCEDHVRLEEDNERLKELHSWIPVTERLPEREQFCHLYIPEFNSNCPQKGWYLPDKKVWMTTTKSRPRTRQVTHWKPIILPE